MGACSTCAGRRPPTHGAFLCRRPLTTAHYIHVQMHAVTASSSIICGEADAWWVSFIEYRPSWEGAGCVPSALPHRPALRCSPSQHLEVVELCCLSNILEKSLSAHV